MLGLTLLLTNAAAALDQLCLARISRDTGVLTPEYSDPTLVLAVEGSPTTAEATLRERLAKTATQLQVAGAVASVQAILAVGEQGRRRVALLAMAGAAAWRHTAALPGGGQIHCRQAADGRVYLLAGAPTAQAAHAPHAMRGYAERLWILPASHACAEGRSLPAEPPAKIGSDGPDSLSLDAALRDLLLRLAEAGDTLLAAEVSALRHDMPALLPAEPARPLPLAPAAAA
jgi:hypothetical protein